MDANADQPVEAPSKINVYVMLAGDPGQEIMERRLLGIEMTRVMHRDPILASTLDERLRRWLLNRFVPRFGDPAHLDRPIKSHLIVDPNGNCFGPDDEKYVDHIAIGGHGVLPDVRGKYCGKYCDWTEEAWKKRTVICFAGLHLLVTLARDGLKPNTWAKGLFLDNIYFMKYSEVKDKDGFFFYEDIFKGEIAKDSKKLLEDIQKFEAELLDIVKNDFRAFKESF